MNFRHLKLFAKPRIDVEFTNIRNLNNDMDTIGDMKWKDIPLADGAFSADDGSIEGVFYGGNHDEVGGVFDKNDIIGAYGASR